MSTEREVGFCLGSNLEDRETLLIQSRDRLIQALDADPAVQSPIFETEPIGVKEEYKHLPFLNAVVIVRSRASAKDWLAEVGRIEQELGRRRTDDRFAPRTIDIDILFAGDEYIDDGGLTVPHPRWTERRFVVQPLAAVRPNLLLPGAGKTVAEILAHLPGDDGVDLFRETW